MTETLTEAQKADLAAISACIIPASERYRVPGADDPAIQADMLATLCRDEPAVLQALEQLMQLAGGPFPALPPDRDSIAVSDNTWSAWRASWVASYPGLSAPARAWTHEGRIA